MPSAKVPGCQNWPRKVRAKLDVWTDRRRWEQDWMSELTEGDEQDWMSELTEGDEQELTEKVSKNWPKKVDKDCRKRGGRDARADESAQIHGCRGDCGDAVHYEGALASKSFLSNRPFKNSTRVAAAPLPSRARRLLAKAGPKPQAQGKLRVAPLQPAAPACQKRLPKPKPKFLRPTGLKSKRLRFTCQARALQTAALVPQTLCGTRAPSPQAKSKLASRQPTSSQALCLPCAGRQSQQPMSTTTLPTARVIEQNSLRAPRPKPKSQRLRRLLGPRRGSNVYRPCFVLSCAAPTIGIPFAHGWGHGPARLQAQRHNLFPGAAPCNPEECQPEGLVYRRAFQLGGVPALRGKSLESSGWGGWRGAFFSKGGTKPEDVYEILWPIILVASFSKKGFCSEIFFVVRQKEAAHKTR